MDLYMTLNKGHKTQDVVSKLLDTTPGGGLKIMLDNIIYRTINDRKKRRKNENSKR